MKTSRDDIYLNRMRESLTTPGMRRRTKLKLAFAIPVLALVMGLASFEQFRDRTDPLMPQQGPATQTAEPEPTGTRGRAVFGAKGESERRERQSEAATDQQHDDKPLPVAEFPVQVQNTREQQQSQPEVAASDTQPVPAEFTQLLEQWRRTLVNGNLDAQVALYAPEVDRFFTKRNVSRDSVRKEKRRFLDRYPEFLKYDVTDVRLESLEADRAAITFRKEWDARGSGRFAGAERQRLTLVKNSGDWKIVGEEELKVYWVRRS